MGCGWRFCAARRPDLGRIPQAPRPAAPLAGGLGGAPRRRRVPGRRLECARLDERGDHRRPPRAVRAVRVGAGRVPQRRPAAGAALPRRRGHRCAGDDRVPARRLRSGHRGHAARRLLGPAAHHRPGRGIGAAAGGLGRVCARAGDQLLGAHARPAGGAARAAARPHAGIWRAHRDPRHQRGHRPRWGGQPPQPGDHCAGVGRRAALLRHLRAASLAAPRLA